MLDHAQPPAARGLDRRSFLKHSAQAAAVGLFSSNLAPLLADENTRGFKIGACQWNLGTDDESCFEIARQIGLDGVQVNMGRVSNDMHLRKPEVQKAFAEAAKKAGVEIASLAIGEMNRVPLKSDPRAAEWLDQSLDICKALGLTVSMPACFHKGDLDMSKTAEIDHLVRVLKEVCPRAEREGIVIGLESYLSAEDNMRLIDLVGSPAMRIYYDVGNSTDKGRDIFREICLLGDLICEFHAKDGRHMLGQGRIDFRKVREAMDDIDYRGWIQIEAARPNGLLPDYRAHCQYLKEIFPAKV